jgi:alpha-amylase/alpha-mannosidase (GH57 family)
VALIWHMHQPDYRDATTGSFLLPWVRLRASKDYARMSRLALRHPGLRISMTMVPSLLLQIAEYVSGSADDPHRRLCLQPAEALTEAERRFLARLLPDTNYGTRIPLFSRRTELRARLGADGEYASTLSVDDMRLVQLWSMLCWIDPEVIRSDDRLMAVTSASSCSEDDKRHVDAVQQGLIADVFPAFREAVAAGIIEPLTCPAFHPILPLLLDSQSARVALPGVEVAEPPFRHREDAVEQVRRGLDIFEEHLGMRPRGIWPSECAVSPETAAVLAETGLQWAVSDQGVLAASLGQDPAAGPDPALYRPHRDPSGLTLVFRDAAISNSIGFDLPGMDFRAAVDELIGRLEGIAERAGPGQLVTIALDGENCWEYYQDNGGPFLDLLYRRLVEHPGISTTHVGAHLDAHPEAIPALDRLWSGSWINASYDTWIGDPNHTRAWSLLGETRAALDAAGGPAAQPEA